MKARSKDWLKAKRPFRIRTATRYLAPGYYTWPEALVQVLGNILGDVFIRILVEVLSALI